FWTVDSQSIIYAKDFGDTSSSKLYQHLIETGETRERAMENGFIRLVGQNGFVIYYFLQTFSGISYDIKSFNIETNQTKEILTIEGPYVTGNIKMSPNGTRALFNYLLVDLRAGTQARVHTLSPLLWFPDGQGLLGGSPLSALRFDETRQPTIDNTPVRLKFPDDIESDQFISWSPDGQYLVYKSKPVNNQAAYFLLDLFSGQIQQFPPARLFQVGGWALGQGSIRMI
ncbi:MAG: hypothetical protein SVR94_19085, partial [Pseudomonadota bacterium]|nr:hypothetical protein [Pseudomonadota bacterium]